jgi:hypothetical protein
MGFIPACVVGKFATGQMFLRRNVAAARLQDRRRETLSAITLRLEWEVIRYDRTREFNRGKVGSPIHDFPGRCLGSIRFAECERGASLRM